MKIEKNIKNNQMIFVTATNTDVGKSYACEQLLKKYAKAGYKVGYIKPIETGVTKEPLDGGKLLRIVKELNPDFTLDINDVVPYQFELPAAPFVAKKSTPIDLEYIKSKITLAQSQCDLLIVEGAGGLMVPIEKDFFIIDLIKMLECKAVLIAPSNLGSINDTMLSIQALEAKAIPFEWYINLYKDKESFEEVTLPFYKAYFGEIKYINE